MRNIILIFTLISLFSCKNSEIKAVFDTSKVTDINDIVETIIIEDSLDVLKNEDGSGMLCEELIKLDIYVPEKSKNGEIVIPPPPIGNVSIGDLLHYGKGGFFSVKDSLYLLNQNSNPQKFTIDKVQFEKFKLTTREKEISKMKAKKSFDFYEISIPIFSSDNKKAYVELSHYCGTLCGDGRSIYLEKVNEKWKIISKRETWIS
jgi:hypothetical protein